MSKANEYNNSFLTWLMVVILAAVIVWGVVGSKNDEPQLVASMQAPAEKLERWGDFYAREAIMEKAGGGIQFQKEIAANYYPNAGGYACKWIISLSSGLRCYGVASLQYKGGDAYKRESWEVTSVNVMQ